METFSSLVLISGRNIYSMNGWFDWTIDNHLKNELSAGANENFKHTCGAAPEWPWVTLSNPQKLRSTPEQYYCLPWQILYKQRTTQISLKWFWYHLRYTNVIDWLSMVYWHLIEQTKFLYLCFMWIEISLFKLVPSLFMNLW